MRAACAVWRLLDFGIVANVGDTPFLRCTPLYAAPEVLRAFDAEEKITVQPSQDIWALGVMLYEIITQGPTFPPGTQASALYECASGRQQYPWEADAALSDAQWRRSRLRGVASLCLARDAAQRPSAREISQKLAQMSSATTSHGSRALELLLEGAEQGP